MDTAGAGACAQARNVVAGSGVDGQARLLPGALPVEEHGVRHVLVPVAGMVLVVHAIGIELVDAGWRGGESGVALRVLLRLFAAGGGGPVIKQLQPALLLA